MLGSESGFLIRKRLKGNSGHVWSLLTFSATGCEFPSDSMGIS